jgi:hypothetical protein
MSVFTGKVAMVAATVLMAFSLLDMVGRAGFYTYHPCMLPLKNSYDLM